jgi:hypothetical protein
MVPPNHLTDTPPGAVEFGPCRNRRAYGEHFDRRGRRCRGNGERREWRTTKTLSSRVRRIVRYPLVGPAQPMMGNSLVAETTRGSSFQRKEFDGPDQGVQDR